MGKSLMICANAPKALKLNESEGNGKRYVLEGVFAELDTLNRNQRIYPKEEYLRHLQYLRDDIKKGEPLLGELDHPDDRFEVKLKEASHRIIDLWYDESSNKVMGKIELLNTPNGKLAQSIVDQGIPLHISSRAAGTVNSDNTVSIQQIYTYDLVCKPGFAGAVLHRVNESADGNKYSVDVNNFLTESNRMESLNAASLYGILNENVSVMDINADANLRNEAKDIQHIDMNKNVNESDFVLENYENDVIRAIMEDDEMPALEAEEPKKDDKEDNGSESDSSDDFEIVNVEAEDSEGEILKVEAEYGDESDASAESEGSSEGSEKSEESEGSDESDSSKDESSETSECSRSKDSDEVKDKLFDCTDIDAKKEKLNELDRKIASLKNKKECACAKANEALAMAEYPVSRCLNEGNLSKFASLSESQKNNVVAYLRDKEMTDAESINENWSNGVNYVAAEPVWLKYAPEYYKNLYESASAAEKESIQYTAKFVLFENQNDVNTFWSNTGLASRSERTLANNEFIENMPKIAAVNESESLPYGKDYINMIAEMACELNG